MEFCLFDKIKNITITPENEEKLGYNVEIYLDGSFSVEKYEQKGEDPEKHWYCKESRDFELKLL